MWLLLLSSAILSAGVAFLGGELLMHNTDAYSVLATVSTVFAGFLFAVIAVLGDPTFVPEGTWRTAEKKRSGIYQRLVRLSYLFSLYLIGIIIVLVGVIAEGLTGHDLFLLWIARMSAFFNIFAILLTVPIPVLMVRIQLEKFDSEIEKRRIEAGLKDVE